jgi:hypothetical protein
MNTPKYNQTKPLDFPNNQLLFFYPGPQWGGRKITNHSPILAPAFRIPTDHHGRQPCGPFGRGTHEVKT